MNTMMMPLVHTMSQHVGSGNNYSGQLQAGSTAEGFMDKLTALLATMEQHSEVGHADQQLTGQRSMFMNAAVLWQEDDDQALTILNLFSQLLAMDDDRLRQLMSEQPELLNLLLAAEPILQSLHHSDPMKVPTAAGHIDAEPSRGHYAGIMDTFHAAQLRQVMVQMIMQMQQMGHIKESFAQTYQLDALFDQLPPESQISYRRSDLLNVWPNRTTNDMLGSSLDVRLTNDGSQQWQSYVTAAQSMLETHAPISALSQMSDASEDDLSARHQHLLALMERIATVATDAKLLPQLTHRTDSHDLDRTLLSDLTVATAHDPHQNVGRGERQQQQPLTTIQLPHFLEQTSPLLIKQVRIAQAEGMSEARIALVPEHLGHVNIHITMKSGQMVAQFMAETLLGKQMLEGQLSQLRNVLQEQGIQVDKLEVIQGQPSSMFQHHKEQHAAKHAMEGHKQRKPDYGSINDQFSVGVDSELQPEHGLLYGSSFEAVV